VTAHPGRGAEQVPGLAALSVGGFAETESVSCAAPGDCSAGGYYDPKPPHLAHAGIRRHRDRYRALMTGRMLAGQRPPLASMPVEYLTPAIEGRALEALILLADRGQHRAPSIPDLIIAATAELAGLTVLHLDKDFEVIADVTGQPMERLDSR
jgi:hypothetical protein